MDSKSELKSCVLGSLSGKEVYELAFQYEKRVEAQRVKWSLGAQKFQYLSE